MFYVYQTARFRQDVDHHAESRGAVARLVQKIQRDQSITHLDQFFPSPFLRKKLGAMRLVVEERPLGEHTVLVFARLMFRSDKVYDAFVRAPDSIRSTYSCSDADVMAAIVDAPEPSGVLALEHHEREWLWSTASDDYDEIVLESADWVERMRQPSYVPWRAKIHELVERACSKDASGDQLADASGDVRILFNRSSDGRRLILVAPILKQDIEHEAQLRRQNHELLTTNAGALDYAAVLRRARRAYPSLVLADVSTWLRIQDSATANLALSPEETDVLQAVLRPPVGTSSRFPIFINGRPGSGKSTVLQYMFASFARSWHAMRQEAELPPPVYITYSNLLLDNARSSVRDILACDAQHGGALAGQTASLDELERRGCFSSFRDFMLSMLEKETAERFQANAYMTFPRFRRMWQQKLGAHPMNAVRALGPELSWHVIRTYIKGMRDEDGSYFSPDDYAELPIKRKSVTDANFGLVYLHVWSSWYSHEHCWDDQDLVRAVLDRAAQDGPKGALRDVEYSAVFCDEAQDFTRIELEFILGLSMFTRRAVPSAELRLIPFAFAGDPFQTLNPTGFDWQSVRSIFHEHVVRSLDRDGRAKLEFNFQELTYNYRSNDPIVSLCNRLQLIRGIAFRVGALQPQRTWFDEAATNVSVFDVGQASIADALRSDAEAVIIVPAHENGEDEFARSDELLSEFLQENGALARTVLSPMRAKGLEFQRVILYKFGDTALREAHHLVNILSSAQPLGGDRDSCLQLEYFVNRLYVAASRARKTLIIADTREAIEQFWRPLGIEPADEKLLAAYGTIDSDAATTWSEEKIGRLYVGNVEQWTSGGDDPLDIADKFLERGNATFDLFLLRRAAAIFKRHKRSAKAKQCDALASEIEENWMEAGGAYAELGNLDKAVECYWKALAFEKIVSMPGVQASIRVDAASFFVSGKSRESAARFLSALVLFLNQTPGASLTLRNDLPMKRCTSTLVDRLGAHAESSIVEDDQPEWAGVWDGLERLGQVGLASLEAPSALAVAFRGGQYARVVDLWPKAAQGRPMTAAIREAHAQALPFPARLKYLAELERWSDIARLAADNVAVRVSDVDAEILVTAHVREGHLQSALELVKAHGVRVARVLDEILREARKARNSAVQRSAGSLVLRHCVEDRQWRRALAVFAGQPHLDPAVRAQLVRDLVGLLAVSEGLASTPPEEQRLIQDFLREEVVRDRTLRGAIPIDELGAAVERAGRHVDALAFYEAVLQGDWRSTDPVRRFARNRWLVTKDKQASSGASAGKHRKELEEAAGRAGMTQLELASELQRWTRYPRPGELADTPVVAKEPLRVAAADEVFDLELGSVQITGRCIRSKRRINLTSAGSVCRVQVSRDRLVCESDELQVSVKEEKDSAQEWLIDPWKLRVRSRVHDDGSFEVSLLSEGSELRKFKL